MSKQSAKKLAKWTAKIAVCSSVSKIVHDVIDAHVVAETPFQQVQVWVGAIVVSVYAQDVTWNHLESEISEAYHAIQDAKSDEPTLKAV